MTRVINKLTPGTTPALDARYKTQVARYNNGVKNGSLDDTEKAQMKSRNQEYWTMLASSKADDGKIDGKERVEMHQFANQTSKELYALKHNQ